MKLRKIPLAQTRAFSSFFIDYIEQKESLQPFYHRTPDIGSFGEQAAEKQALFPSAHRTILADTLTEQYKHVSIADSVKKNIDALRDNNTFTVTTGHQLNIFTGPLYFIYKIVTVVNACKILKEKYPQYNFVPVYWMASEDHDYDEIRYFRLYGKKYIWDTDQKGAVGRFHTQDFKTLLKDLPGDTTIFQEAYLKNKRLSDAVRQYVNALFGSEGVVVVDADSRALKSLFTTVMKQDILDHVSLAHVEKTNASLEKLGYKPQIHCREINFFYLDDQLRSRIEEKDGRFHIVDSTLSFSKEEMEAIINDTPEKISPNVILRPVYEQVILPDVAYVGGPAEVIYWLQLKSVFDHFKIPFPVLMPRNFAMAMDHTVTRKFEKTGLALSDLFEDKNYIFNHWVLKNSSHDLTVGTERTKVTEIFENLRQRAAGIDKTLNKHIDAEGKRAIKSLETIEHKLLRAEKRLHTDKLRQIEAVKDALFPNGSLQERTDNFLNFYQQDRNFIKHLLNNFDPFDYQFNILQYTEDEKG